MKRYTFIAVTISIGLCLCASGARAADTIINFDDLTLSDYDDIPTNYGSNALNTPNIGVAYRTFDSGNDNTLNNNIDFWNAGYGDLSKVGFAVSNGAGAEITLTPTGGNQVTLTSFDLAGYNQANLGASFIRVVDTNNNVLWSAGNLTVSGAGPSHSTYVTNISSSNALRIQWGTNWNIGIDNITFSQNLGASAPEPGSLALLAVPAVLLALQKRRHC